jgi:hypothetical protein
MKRELTIKDFQKAVIQDEVDRGKIKWRNRKWKLPHKAGMVINGIPYYHRPPPKVYYEILKRAGKNVCVCEVCGSDLQITIHHKDGNPFNNEIKNLQVLCWSCHLLSHEPTDEPIHHELEGTKQDIDPLDAEETRRFLGVIDE